MAAKGTSHFLFWLSYYFLSVDPSHSFTDTILQGQQLKDSDWLISSNGIFKLGFFIPGSSTKRYLGIWYNTADEKDNPVFIPKKKVVWVANRDVPISDESGVLQIDKFGKLAISYSGGGSVALSSAEAASNVSATLLDSGNFVLEETGLDGYEKDVLWQSFDYPTDTLLPGMKLGIDDDRMRTWSLTSWINDNLPDRGSFSLTIGIGFNDTSQLVIWWKGSIYWTSGIWQTGHFAFIPRLSNEGNPNFSYISNGGERYFLYSPSNLEKHSLSSYTMDSSGSILERGGMAPFGACTYNSDPGCVELQMPNCRSSNDFFVEKKLSMSKQGEKVDQSYKFSHFDCNQKCLNNCSCVAYAYTTTNQTVCELWNKQMLFIEKNGETRHIHVLKTKKAKRWIWPVVAAAGLVALLMALLLMLFIRQRRTKLEAEDDAEQEILLRALEDSNIDPSQTGKKSKVKRNKKNSLELNFFSFQSIVSATENFSTANKIGEGGFGRVYKGILQDGQQVAVKRLSRNSGQGIAEFRNELVLIAKLQHTNLVRLVGCCIQKEEKILIYEFMANKSLDFFIFDPTLKNQLDWKKRLRIIEGISQGLLYLHKYSRLRIVHRDLKAGNILLDAEMNPKISDFGIARIFGRKESETKTRRVVGTHGYMAPEYALKGIVSPKADVFSFGVLLLEIVSSKKHNKTYGSEYPLNLIRIAWDLWSEDRGLELMDPTMSYSCPHNEVLRCIHIGLLCVQDQPADRPNISEVVSMLASETSILSKPKQPVFFLDRFEEKQQIADHQSEKCSVTNVSITTVVAR